MEVGSRPSLEWAAVYCFLLYGSRWGGLSRQGAIPAPGFLDLVEGQTVNIYTWHSVSHADKTQVLGWAATHTTLLPNPASVALSSCLLDETDFGNGGGAIPLSEACLDCDGE